MADGPMLEPTSLFAIMTVFLELHTEEEDALIDERSEDNELIRRVLEGNPHALAEAFTHFRGRLRAMVHLRLHPRLHRRVDPSDVLQEAFVELQRQHPEFVEKRPLPFFLWLRSVTGQTLGKVHRRHLDAGVRDSKLEVSLHAGRTPQASSYSLAARLVGKLTTASDAAIRAEVHAQVHEFLESMDPMDREILTLRHLEELSNKEAALELGIEADAASKRYLRALKRFGDVLAATSGFGSEIL